MILKYKLADAVKTPPLKYIIGDKVAIKFPWKTLYFKKNTRRGYFSNLYLLSFRKHIGCRSENKEEIIKKFKQAKK